MATLPLYFLMCSAFILSPRSRFPDTQMGGSMPSFASSVIVSPTIPVRSVMATTVDGEQNFSDTLDENFDKLIDAAEMEKNSGKDIDSDFYFPCGGLSYDK